MEDKIYYCQNCGGIMVFDAASQTLKCPNCDTQTEIHNHQSKIIEHAYNGRVASNVRPTQKTSSTMQCKGCGAIVEVAPNCTATECVYCGTKYVIADKQQEDILPDAVVPFKIDIQNVKTIFTKWIGKRWLAPSKLKNLYESGGIQGMYVPYWTFDADADCTYTAEGGKERKERVQKKDGSYEEKTVVDWYNTSGRVAQFFDDVLVCASKNMNKSLLKGIEPTQTKNDVVSYSPEYLSGYSSECYTVPIDEAHREAISVMDNKLKKLAESDVKRTYDKVRNVSIRPMYHNETYKHILYPVYATAFSYNNKVYNVVINGENGKVKGQYPKSPVKIGIIIAVIVAIFIFLFVSKNARGDKYQPVNMNQDNIVYEIPADDEETAWDNIEIDSDDFD